MKLLLLLLMMMMIAINMVIILCVDNLLQNFLHHRLDIFSVFTQLFSRYIFLYLYFSTQHPVYSIISIHCMGEKYKLNMYPVYIILQI
jgi:hypothetical protein